MDWHIVLAAIAGILAAVSVVPYVRDMLHGTTRPNIVSWGLWFLIQVIFASAQFAAGASYSIILPIMGVMLVGGVFVLGLAGYGYKKYGPLDFVCLLTVLAALVLWHITSSPMVALWLAVAADFFASLPTAAKAYRDPTSETWLAYFITIFSAIATALSTTIYDLPNLLWPVYIILGNIGLLGLLWIGSHKSPKKGKRKH